MLRKIALVMLASLALGPDADAPEARAATLATHALVALVPPVEVRWTVPEPAWRVQTGEPATWQARLETRRLDGTLVDARPLPSVESTGGGQDPTTVPWPAGDEDAAPVHVRLILCRE